MADVVEHATNEMIEHAEDLIFDAFEVLDIEEDGGVEKWRLAVVVACVRMAIFLGAMPCVCRECLEKLSDADHERLKAGNGAMLDKIMAIVLPTVERIPAFERVQ